MTEEAKPTAVSATKPRRLDLLVLWGGIAFSLAFAALIWWSAGSRAGGRRDHRRPVLRQKEVSS